MRQPRGGHLVAHGGNSKYLWTRFSSTRQSTPRGRNKRLVQGLKWWRHGSIREPSRLHRSRWSKGSPCPPISSGPHTKGFCPLGADIRKTQDALRQEQNYLADRNKSILFVPIRPEQLQDGMDALFKYLQESNDTPLIKAAISHVEFEALHPFKDGNGRIGRMLITLSSLGVRLHLPASLLHQRLFRRAQRRVHRHYEAGFRDG